MMQKFADVIKHQEKLAVTHAKRDIVNHIASTNDAAFATIFSVKDSGKSTQVPPMILIELYSKRGCVLVVHDDLLALELAFRRVQRECSVLYGEAITVTKYRSVSRGFSRSLCGGGSGEICFISAGNFLSCLEEQPTLEGVDCVVLDDLLQDKQSLLSARASSANGLRRAKGPQSPLLRLVSLRSCCDPHNQDSPNTAQCEKGAFIVPVLRDQPDYLRVSHAGVVSAVKESVKKGASRIAVLFDGEAAILQFVREWRECTTAYATHAVHSFLERHESPVDMIEKALEADRALLLVSQMAIQSAFPWGALDVVVDTRCPIPVSQLEADGEPRPLGTLSESIPAAQDSITSGSGQSGAELLRRMLHRELLFCGDSDNDKCAAAPLHLLNDLSRRGMVCHCSGSAVVCGPQTVTTMGKLAAKLPFATCHASLLVSSIVWGCFDAVLTLLAAWDATTLDCSDPSALLRAYAADKNDVTESVTRHKKAGLEQDSQLVKFATLLSDPCEWLWLQQRN